MAVQILNEVKSFNYTLYARVRIVSDFKYGFYVLSKQHFIFQVKSRAVLIFPDQNQTVLLLNLEVMPQASDILN